MLVPNPVSGANYTCRVHPHSAAAQCYPHDATVLNGARFEVDKVEARLSLLEAAQQDLRTKNERLQAENSQLTTSVQTLQAENNELETRLDHINR
nr:hypothetical protein BaRGS_007230 [Batillaria attramentaria]